VRLRPAEVGEHAVAHVFRDVSAPTLHHLGAAFLVGADHLAQVFGIQPRRKRGRRDQIDEQHGQLASLRRGFRSHASGGLEGRSAPMSPGRLGLLEISDRLEQEPAVTDRRHPEFPEVIAGQVRQRAGVDRVIAERLCITLQPQLPQPRLDVHRSGPRRSPLGPMAKRASAMWLSA
jgi:hypothetical protein